jgi:Fe-S-cluster formation regulator IscX/YfhJ
MTISISIEPSTGTAIASCSGVLRRSDAERGAAALWGTPGWPGKTAVWDFRDARFDLNASDIQEIARFILRRQPETPPSRVAFVTARDVDFGMARMFEAFRDDPRTEFRVFRCYDDAVKWAGYAEPAGS